MVVLSNLRGTDSGVSSIGTHVELHLRLNNPIGNIVANGTEHQSA